MTVRAPVLISTVTAIPGVRLTRLSSICIWVRSSEMRAAYTSSCPLGSLVPLSVPGTLSPVLSCGLSRTIASCDTLTTLPRRSPYRVKLKVSILISASCPGWTKPMSRFDTIASISRRLSAGTTTSRAWAGVTTPPTVWMASCCTTPSTGAVRPCNLVRCSAFTRSSLRPATLRSASTRSLDNVRRNSASEGRPQIAADLRALIRRMSLENRLWGAPRIHGELLKLGFVVAQSTVAKYMAKKDDPSGQSWGTFLRNHAPHIAAMDLFVAPTIGFNLLYVLVIVRLARRELVWINVTAHPTAEWIAQQITQALPWNEVPRYLIRDRDGIYGATVRRRL